MNDRPDLATMVTDWLQSEAPRTASDGVLAAAMEQVAHATQERHLTQRVLGDRLGGSRRLRWSIALGLVVLGAMGAFAIAGALLREPAMPRGAATNGWIAFHAHGGAGPNLEGDASSRIHRDLYVVREGAKPHLIIGTPGDELYEGCPAFLADGTRLAYTEFDGRQVQATPPPQPAGEDAAAGTDAPEAAPPPTGGSPETVVVLAVDDDATPAATIARIEVDPAMGGCPAWSPDGSRFVYAIDDQSGRNELRLVTLDGKETRIVPTGSPESAAGGNGEGSRLSGEGAWSPDGTTLAVVNDRRLLLILVDGGSVRVLPGQGFDSVTWSPDGTHLAAGVGSELRVLTLDGSLVSTAITAVPGSSLPAYAWSPDGHWIAYVDGDEVIQVAADGSARVARTVEIERVLEGLLDVPLYPPDPFLLGWSPDGERLLLGAGGIDTPGALVSINATGEPAPVILVKPTYAIRGVEAAWQAVYR